MSKTDLPLSFETLDMTFKGLGEMFKGNSAGMCTEKFPQVSMGGRDLGARIPIGVPRFRELVPRFCNMISVRPTF